MHQQSFRAGRPAASHLHRPVFSPQVYPDLPDRSPSRLPPSSFFTCSSDSTIRLWDAGPPAGHRNLLSHVGARWCRYTQRAR